MKSDIEIAQEAVMQPIKEVAVVRNGSILSISH